MTASRDDARAREEEAVEAVLIRYDVDMKMPAIADKLRDDLMALIRQARDDGARGMRERAGTEMRRRAIDTDNVISAAAYRNAERAIRALPLPSEEPK